MPQQRKPNTEKVARYRHAQLSAVRLAGDINAGNNDDVTLDELLVTIKSEMVKLGPHIGLDPNQLLLLQGAGIRSPVTVNGSEPEAISPRPVGRRAWVSRRRRIDGPVPGSRRPLARFWRPNVGGPTGPLRARGAEGFRITAVGAGAWRAASAQDLKGIGAGAGTKAYVI